MAITSNSTDVPSPVEPTELYDGPQVNGHDSRGAEAAKPAELFSDQQPANPVDQAQMLKVVFDILSTRVLGLVATVAACVIWGFAVWRPDLSRTGAALGFSVTVLIPVVALYWRSKS